MADIIIGPTGLALDVIGVKGEETSGELSECITAPGGSQLNLAYGLSVLGHRVKVIGCFGDDPAGQICLQDLVQCGIDVTHMIRTEGVTYTAFVLTEPELPRRTIFANTRGLGGGLFQTGVDFAGKLRQIGRGDFYGMLAAAPQNPEEQKQFLEIFRTAREMKMRTFLEPPEDPKMLHQDLLKPLLPYIDLFLPGEKELTVLTGIKDCRRGSRKIREQGCRTVVCKLGAAGCCVVSEEGEAFVPGYDVTVRDLTGAGDGFAAGLIHGLSEGRPLEQAADFANRYAAANIRKTGPRAGMECEAAVLAAVTQRRKTKGNK